MRKIKWELPFKNMHYLESLTEDLANHPNIILMTAIQDKEGVVGVCKIHLKETEENMDDVILHIGTIIGAHSAGYAVMMKEKEEALDFCFGVIEEILTAQEQEQDGGPKGEDFKPKEDKGVPEVEEDKEEVAEEKKDPVEEVVETTEEAIEEEKVEETIKEIAEIPEVKKALKPKTKRKDSKFVAALRVILVNFKK